MPSLPRPKLPKERLRLRRLSRNGGILTRKKRTFQCVSIRPPPAAGASLHTKLFSRDVLQGAGGGRETEEYDGDDSRCQGDRRRQEDAAETYRAVDLAHGPIGARMSPTRPGSLPTAAGSPRRGDRGSHRQAVFLAGRPVRGLGCVSSNQPRPLPRRESRKTCRPTPIRPRNASSMAPGGGSRTTRAASL